MQIDSKFIQTQILPHNDRENEFIIDVGKLRSEQLSVLKAIYKAGEKHLKYFSSTMSAFKFPERRLKAFDTVYFEQVMPEIAKILREHEQIQKQRKS